MDHLDGQGVSFELETKLVTVPNCSDKSTDDLDTSGSWSDHSQGKVLAL